MGIDVSKQLLQIGVSWLTGFTAGFAYDVFRVLRRRLKASSLFDGLFCLAVLFALFCLGFASYMLLLSDLVLALLNKIVQLIAALFAPILLIMKKAGSVVKKHFSKAGNWAKLRAQKRRKGKEKTVEEDTMHFRDSSDGAGRIRYTEPRRRDERS